MSVSGERMRVPTHFKELCFKIQNDRILGEMETSKNPMSIEKIAGMIANMINANENIFDKLVEAKINGKN